MFGLNKLCSNATNKYRANFKFVLEIYLNGSDFVNNFPEKQQMYNLYRAVRTFGLSFKNITPVATRK